MIRRTIALLVLLLPISSCGIPKSTDFDAIEPDNIPEQLTATSTTSTTTTTTTLPSTSTTESPSESTTTTTMPETTTTVPTELIEMYYIVGRQIRQNVVLLERDPKPLQVLLALEQPPATSLSPGLRTAVPVDGIVDATPERGNVTIELSPDFFEVLKTGDSADPLLAIAQIVMTVTRMRGISTVTFTRLGEPIEVPLPDAVPSEPGQMLYYDDYRQFLDDPVTTPTTTTSATETTPTSIAG